MLNKMKIKICKQYKDNIYSLINKIKTIKLA